MSSNIEHAAERHTGRSHAERGNEDDVMTAEGGCPTLKHSGTQSVSTRERGNDPRGTIS